MKREEIWVSCTSVALTHPNQEKPLGIMSLFVFFWFVVFPRSLAFHFCDSGANSIEGMGLKGEVIFFLCWAGENTSKFTAHLCNTSFQSHLCHMSFQFGKLFSVSRGH